MNLIANYHTHLALCGHAEGEMEDYIKSAINSKYAVLGISDHGPILTSDLPSHYYKDFGLDLQMNYEDFVQYYIPTFNILKPQYQDQIKLFLGLEIEYYPAIHDYLSRLRKELDYLILGMHYFPSGNEFYNVYELMNEDLIMKYAKNTVEALNSGLFTVMAHPDIFVYHYIKNGRYAFDEVCVNATRLIIEAAIKNNVFLEINVGGFHRPRFFEDGIEKYAYPRYDFWEIVATYKEAKVIIGVDAHHPDHLQHPDINKAIDFANSVGVSVSKFIPKLS